MGFELLSPAHLVRLVSSVFPRLPKDKILAVLVDLPNDANEERQEWQQRRAFAVQLRDMLDAERKALELEAVWLIGYKNVGSNNGDLPDHFYRIDKKLPAFSGDLGQHGQKLSAQEFYETVQIIMAPTQYSTTAPLKLTARTYGFRAATMPGFSPGMLPALQIDYKEVARRLQILKQKLDAAEAAEIFFQVRENDHYFFKIDLRFRTAHLSAGRFPDPGMVGNLPSGETYIVPYEGETDAVSQTQGDLPVQFGNDVLLYHVLQNRAREVYGEGEAARLENARLVNEPAYGNIAELGFGVLADFGVEPVGEILLDEKLGLHIAFGRSDHFGGFVGAGQFSSPQALVHIDRIYIPQTQPDVVVASVKFLYKDGKEEEIMRDGQYTIFKPLA